MEIKLRDLRKAMDATTHSGKHFSEEQKNNIRAEINSGGHYNFSKPRRFHVFAMTSVVIAVLVLFVSSQFDFMASREPDQGEHMVNMPEDIPGFVKESDIRLVDWNRIAEPFGRNMVGNEYKSGVIGMDMPSLEEQKWMWHLWGTDAEELTVVGFHRESKIIHPLLINGWTTELAGENNGADVHIASSVKIPERGEWAILLYADGELFDILVYEFWE